MSSSTADGAADWRFYAEVPVHNLASILPVCHPVLEHTKMLLPMKLKARFSMLLEPLRMYFAAKVSRFLTSFLGLFNVSTWSENEYVGMSPLHRTYQLQHHVREYSAKVCRSRKVVPTFGGGITFQQGSSTVDGSRSTMTCLSRDSISKC